MSSGWTPGSLLWKGDVDDKSTTIQTLGRDGHKHNMVFCGSEILVSVRDARTQEHFK